MPTKHPEIGSKMRLCEQTTTKLQFSLHLVKRLRRLLQELKPCYGVRNNGSPRSGLYLSYTNNKRATKTRDTADNLDFKMSLTAHV